MLLDRLVHNAILPALDLLPERMRSRDAVRMLAAIAMQESDAHYRRQIGGPARGYYGFERDGGVAGVIKHPATAEHVTAVCVALDYAVERQALYEAIEHNDILASALARLNLWWLPRPLARTSAEGWSQYISAWRPGKPRVERWAYNWRLAEKYTDALPDPIDP